jgi:integrase/recombinase XerD
MTVLVYTRHSITCPKQDDRDWRRCDCPKWHEYMRNGHQVRKTAKTRSWEAASKKAREIETRLEAGELPEKAAPITVKDAIAKYLQAKAAEGLQTNSLVKPRGMMARLQTWCDSKGLVYLRDVKADHLHDWRNSWEFGKNPDGSLSPSWKIHWAVAKSLFTHAYRLGWIPTNEADKLKGFKTRSKQVQPFDKGQMSLILGAVDKCGWDSATCQRIRVFILLMRWSGLAIRDASCLKRTALDAHNRIHTHRAKTKTDVFVPLPKSVSDALRSLPKLNAQYFFWDAETKSPTVPKEYGKLLEKVFTAAGVDGTSHQFRHTFACEMLIAGMPLETVSKLLGHRSIAVTERHYAAWVPERQTKLETAVKSAWQTMELPE